MNDDDEMHAIFPYIGFGSVIPEFGGRDPVRRIQRLRHLSLPGKGPFTILFGLTKNRAEGWRK
jgi:hypothetical protein